MDIKGKRGFYLLRKTKKAERGESHQQDEKEKEDESRFPDMTNEPFFFSLCFYK